MTAAAFVSEACAERLENSAEQLESLRRRMLEMSGRHVPPETCCRSRPRRWPGGWSPGGRSVLSGARSLLLNVVASVTAAGATPLSSASRISVCWPPSRWGPT